MLGNNFIYEISILSNMSENEQPNEIESRVFGWLNEEEYKVQKIRDAKANFNFIVVLPNGNTITVFQPIASFDKIFIGTGIILTQDQQNKLSTMSREMRDNLFESLLIGFLDTRVQLREPLKLPLNLSFTKAVYLDGLNKNLFMSALVDVYSAMVISTMKIEKELGRFKSTSPDLGYIY